MESTLDAADPDVMRILPKMKRGDLSKMSFAFSMRPDGVTQWTQTGDGEDGEELREILRVGRLYDVSIVTEPAYAGTEIALRSREEARKANAPGDAEATALFRRRKALDLRIRRPA
jgi:HK97 family phage prohead protease